MGLYGYACTMLLIIYDKVFCTSVTTGVFPVVTSKILERKVASLLRKSVKCVAHSEWSHYRITKPLPWATVKTKSLQTHNLRSLDTFDAKINPPHSHKLKGTLNGFPSYVARRARGICFSIDLAQRYMYLRILSIWILLKSQCLTIHVIMVTKLR